MGEPDDAALLELGRLIWAAISLEDIVYQMRRGLGPEPDRLSSAPISEWIKDALRVLGGWPELEIRDTACRWFIAAREALEERNSVLHSVPGTRVTISADRTVAEHGQVLDHFSKRKNGSYRQIPMTEDGLRPIRQRLADARSSWVEIYLVLIEEHKRIAPGGM